MEVAELTNKLADIEVELGQSWTEVTAACFERDLLRHENAKLKRIIEKAKVQVSKEDDKIAGRWRDFKSV